MSRGDDGLEVKTDVDVLTDASAVTMDGKDLKSGIGGMIDDRIGELIDGAPDELDTLKEIADELSKNQSGVTTILKKLGDKVDKDGDKVLSDNNYTNADKTKVDAIPSNPKYTDTTYDLSEYAKIVDVQELSNIVSYKLDNKNISDVIEFEIETNNIKVKDDKLRELLDNGKMVIVHYAGKKLDYTDTPGYAGVILYGRQCIGDLVTETYRTFDNIDDVKNNNIDIDFGYITSQGLQIYNECIQEEFNEKANKSDIADFMRCKVLTQSEYDALSSTEKNRADTLYFIKK